MSTEPLSHQILDRSDRDSFFQVKAENAGQDRAGDHSLAGASAAHRISPMRHASEFRRSLLGVDGTLLQFPWKPMSRWSISTTKRAFDCLCVLASLPILLPMLIVVGGLVRFTSRGPVFFLQRRVGLHGREFTIFKFRTMAHVEDQSHHPITTADNQRFTSIGPFLRRWKLDELPQLINVLIGNMSLVGPRPKLREHVISDLPCRPGITGLATTVFAREEMILARIPKENLDAYFHDVILPAKRELDAEYMSKATFYSDIRLIVDSVLRRYDTTALESFVPVDIEIEEAKPSVRTSSTQFTMAHRSASHATSRAVEAEHASAL